MVIATNIHVLLMTAFVLQDHICSFICHVRGSVHLTLALILKPCDSHRIITSEYSAQVIRAPFMMLSVIFGGLQHLFTADFPVSAKLLI